MENGVLETDSKRVSQNNSSNNPYLNEDLDSIYDKKFLPLMLLLFYNVGDIQLNILIITLIFKCFTQRSRLVQSLKKVQVLFDDRDHLLFDHIGSKILQLKFMCEQSEVWLHTNIMNLPHSLDYNYKFAIYRVIDILKELIDLLYGSVEIENQNIYLNENKHELSDLDPMRQIMMRNLKVHEILLKLLRDGSYVFEDITEKNEENKLVIQVFQLSYDFLLNFCLKDNKENKKLLHKEINLFIAHLDFYEVGQTALINEIYHNNYKITVDVKIKYLSSYMDKISNKNGKGGHNPLYLNFFESIMFEKNQPIKENFSKIISTIIDSSNKYEFFYMKENPYYNMDVPEEETSKLINFKKQFGHHIFNLEYLERDIISSEDIPYLYHAKVLKIVHDLITLSFDKQIFKLILQKTLNMNYIFYLLTLDDIYTNKGPKEYLLTIMHKPLLKIVNEVWLNSEKPPSSIFNNNFIIRFINKHIILLKNLTKSDMEQVINARRTSFFGEANRESPIRKQNSSDVLFMYESIEIDNFFKLSYEEGEEAYLNEIISKYCSDYTFDYIDTLINEIIPIILSLNSLLILNETSIEDSKREDIKALNDFCETFSNFYKKNLTSNDIFKKKGNLKILQEFQRTFNANLDLPHERDDPNEKFEDLEREIEEEIQLPLKNILENRKWSKNQQKHNFWRVFVLNVLISSHVKDLIVQEKEALLEAIIHIEDLKYPETLKSKMKKQITLEGFMKKLVGLIKHGFGKDEGVSTLIVNQVIVLLKDILDYCKNPHQKAHMQNILQKSNLVKTLLYFLSFKDLKKYVYKNIIDLCNSLLEGGNVECQNAFFDYFINTSSSEVLFAGIYDIINQQLAFNVHNSSLHRIMDFFMKNVDYSYKNNKFGLNNVLRFLQLLTENHNVNLQV